MRYLLLFIIGSFVFCPRALYAKVRVFACEPEWAALAEEIGGDQISVFTATSARQDPHYIRAKPSLIAQIRRSDLVIGSGASLEVGWLPVLLRKAGNSRITPGGIGFLMASEVVPLLEKTGVSDRSHGDVHPDGNPHVHLDPSNISLVVDELVKRLVLIDSENQVYFQNRHADFSRRWSAAKARWKDFGSSLRDRKIVVHHESFSYLENWLGFHRIATLEPKPGLPPTTSHLESLLTKLRKHPAAVILRTPYNPDKGSLWLSAKTGIPALELPYTPGGDEHCRDLFTLFDRTLELLRGTMDVK